MKDKKILQSLQDQLYQEKMDSTLLSADEVIPYDRILLFLGLDDKQREKNLEISSILQATLPDLKLKEFNRIQFQFVFPFKVTPSAVSQMTSLICFLNKRIELHGFEFDEVELTLSYRYMFIYGEENYNKELFLSLIGFLFFAIDLFYNTLEKVSLGQETFDDVLEQIVKASKALI